MRSDAPTVEISWSNWWDEWSNWWEIKLHIQKHNQQKHRNQKQESGITFTKHWKVAL